MRLSKTSRRPARPCSVRAHFSCRFRRQADQARACTDRLSPEGVGVGVRLLRRADSSHLVAGELEVRGDGREERLMIRLSLNVADDQRTRVLVVLRGVLFALRHCRLRVGELLTQPLNLRRRRRRNPLRSLPGLPLCNERLLQRVLLDHQLLDLRGCLDAGALQLVLQPGRLALRLLFGSDRLRDQPHPLDHRRLRQRNTLL
mmetsp:Transcript_16357/g.37412  ORF Transcript_16357/g.37412 Transcript_16357/m.37412 type:complete len:202 (-) Transcript_16357:1088-1693(-)